MSHITVLDKRRADLMPPLCRRPAFTSAVGDGGGGFVGGDESVAKRWGHSHLLPA